MSTAKLAHPPRSLRAPLESLEQLSVESGNLGPEFFGLALSVVGHTQSVGPEGRTVTARPQALAPSACRRTWYTDEYPVNLFDVQALREKYEEMLRLRLETDGSDPRRRMAELASRFPGALREIDELPLEAIEARIEALRAAEEGGEIFAWMKAIHLFHVLTRGALCAKRWVGEREDKAAPTATAFDAACETLSWGGDAAAWRGDLDRIAHPPAGRVTALVYEKIAAQLGMSTEEARLLVFGVSRRERAGLH